MGFRQSSHSRQTATVFRVSQVVWHSRDSCARANQEQTQAAAAKQEGLALSSNWQNAALHQNAAFGWQKPPG